MKYFRAYLLLAVVLRYLNDYYLSLSITHSFTLFPSFLLIISALKRP